MRQDSKCPVLAFTSPNKGDGKSTVTANLAISLAQAGRKVLLVDCDLRRPNMHKLFGLANDKGLSDVLSGTEPADNYSLTPNLDTLKILTAGTHRKNPAELLMSAAFKDLLAKSREQFDIVLLDCPPVLAVADPCIVGSQCDGVVAVLRLSRDTKPQATRARDMLGRVGATILGVVVNVAEDADKTGYGKYSDAGYAYDYGYKYNKYNRDYYTEPQAEEEVLS
jgi:capsular exopolysaccharide synthesis family protein